MRRRSSEAEKPAATGATAPDGKPGRAAERDIRWSMPSVSEDGKLVVASARSADNKDRWFVTLDPASGKTKVIDTLHDDAWIREIGGSAARVSSSCPTIARAWFLSERDGWMHLYTLDVGADGARAKQLTEGKWEITSASVARDGKKFFLTSTENHPGERHLYTVSVDGGARTKITSMTGSNEATVSPDESALGLVYSYSTKPPEVYVMPNTPGRAGPADHHDADRRVAGVQLDRSEGHHVQGARRRRRLRATLHAGDDRRPA